MAAVAPGCLTVPGTHLRRSCPLWGSARRCLGLEGGLPRQGRTAEGGEARLAGPWEKAPLPLGKQAQLRGPLPRGPVGTC